MNKAILKRNLSFSVGSNAISLLVSALMIFILPKIMLPDDYGGWQLYLFYFYYTGFFHFGWLDGMYLRYGGSNYEDLNKTLYGTQIACLIGLESLLAICIIIGTYIYITEPNLKFVLTAVSITGTLNVLRSFYTFVLQMTNRISEYAKITVVERILFAFAICTFAISGLTYFEQLVYLDVLVKIIALSYAVWVCRDLFQGLCSVAAVFSEIKSNILVGVNLMFANIASMLIVGILRFSVSRQWSLAVFGEISLTLALSSLLMVFINAISIVLFPALRTVDKARLADLYMKGRNLLMPILLAGLILYFPLSVVLKMWLPKYVDSISWMAILFPACVYECKMQMLINTYLKCLRQERLMLNVNLAAVFASAVLALITAYWLHNLTLIVLAMVTVFAIRSSVAEYCLSKILKVDVGKDLLVESLMVVLFIVCSWAIGDALGALLYSFIGGMYCWLNRDRIKHAYECIVCKSNKKTYER